ncbi:MAG: glycosyltransferase family 39 protein [Saprospiraceae bacterium]|nr:glycosyltransferase family 39 protein [Saprospiraceae bacterium]
MAAKKRSSKKKNKEKTPSSKNQAKKIVSQAKQNEKLPEGVQEQQISKALPKTSFWLNTYLHITLVAVLSIVIYGNTIQHKYAVDDTMVILDNDFTRQGSEGLYGIFTEDAFVGFFKGRRDLVSGGRYRPLSIATFAMELQLFGEKTTKKENIYYATQKKKVPKRVYNPSNISPHVSHLINILLYALLCIVIYLSFLEMFNPTHKTDQIKGYFIALAGALLYATHPIHTEAVANIKGRDEIMVLLGSMLALLWTLRSINRPEKSTRYLLMAAGAFAFGIFSKENAVTFLAIIPCALYFFTKASIKKIAIRTAIFLAITFAFLGIRSNVLELPKEIQKERKRLLKQYKNEGNKALLPRELMNNPFLKTKPNVPYTHYEDAEKFASIIHSWQIYLRLTVFPLTLTNDYYPKYIRTDDGPVAASIPMTDPLVEYSPEDFKETIPTFGSPTVLCSLFIHLLLAIIGFWGLIKRKPIAFCIIFYAATFSVISNLFFPIGTNLAERFLFLPTVGFSLACALGLFTLAQFLQKKNNEFKQKVSLQDLKIPIVILVIVCSAYSVKTIIRNMAWADDYTLFTTDVANSPYSAKLNNAVAGVLQEQRNWDKYAGEDLEKKEEMVTRAWRHASVAKALHPNYNQAWVLFANANFHLGTVKDSLSRASTDPAEQKALRLQTIKLYENTYRAYNHALFLKPSHNDVFGNRNNLNKVFMIVAKEDPALLAEYLQEVQTKVVNQQAEAHESLFMGLGYTILGAVYEEEGAAFQAQQQIEQANNLYTQASNAYTIAVNHLDTVNFSTFHRSLFYLQGIANMNYGRLWGQRANQMDKAIPMLNKAVQAFRQDLFQNKPPNYYNSSKKNIFRYYPEALEAFNMAGTANGILGTITQNPENHLTAIQYFTIYADAFPDNPNTLKNLESAYHHLSIIMNAQGNGQKAQAYEKQRLQYEAQRKKVDPNFQPLITNTPTPAG